MKTILTAQNITVLVDDEDFESLSVYCWNIYDRYAETKINGKTVKMHRLILGITDHNIHTDHINGVTVDNRKENLRVCNRFQNQQNRKTNSNNKLGEKGIVKIPSGHYRVRVQAFGNRCDLGVFKTLEEAKLAREQYAKENHGKFYR